MNTVRVCITIPAEFNRFIELEQEKMRRQTNKKVSKEEILFKLCRIGMQKSQNQVENSNSAQNLSEEVSQNSNSAQNLSGKDKKLVQKIDSAQNLSDENANLLQNVQNFSGFAQDFESKKQVFNENQPNFSENALNLRKIKYVFEQKAELEEMYETIREKDDELNEKLEDLNEAQEILFEKQKRFLIEQETFSAKVFDYQYLQNAVKEKELEIEELKEENASFHSLLAKNTKTLDDFRLDFREFKKESSSFLNKILPQLPTIALVIYSLFRKQKPDNEMKNEVNGWFKEWRN